MLKKGQFERLFPRADDDGEKDSDQCSYYSIRSYCKRQKEASFQLEVEYKRSSLNPYRGRQYAQGGSLQNIRTSIRKFLTDGIYRDYDMANAHPMFLLEYCNKGVGPVGRRRHVPHACLKEYCDDRQTFLDEVGVNKKFMLKLFNKDRTDYMVRNHCFKLKQFSRELACSKKMLFEHYAQNYDGNALRRFTYNYDRSGKNPMSSFLWAMMTGDNEDVLLSKAVGRLDETKVGCLLFDGFLYEDAIDPNFFQELQDDTKDELGPIDWKEKPNESNVPLPDMLAENTYEKVKKEFEDENSYFATKIMDPPVFVVRLNGHRVFYKKPDFITAFESLSYQTLDNGEIKEECFLKKWFRDGEIQVKDKVGVYPRREDCPDNIYNIWDDFDVMTWDRSDYEYDEHAVDVFLHHLKVLTNYEDQVYEFLLKWTAHIFQMTHMKPNVCPVMLGEQGIGKDMYLDTIATLMGSKKRYESTSPEQEVYGSFNPLLIDAIVVQLSEIDKSNTLGHIGHLKSLITAPTITINDKHKSPIVVPSLHRYIIVSNNEDPITQESGQRRFVSMYGSSRHKHNKGYFVHYLSTINGDKNALMSIYDMLMNVKAVPKTFSHIDQYQSKFQTMMAIQNVAYHEGFVKYMIEKVMSSYPDEESVIQDYDIRDLYTTHFRTYMHETGARLEGYSLKKLRNRLTALSVNYSIDVLDGGTTIKFTFKTRDDVGLVQEFRVRNADVPSS